MEIQRTLQGETEQFHLCLYSASDVQCPVRLEHYCDCLVVMDKENDKLFELLLLYVCSKYPSLCCRALV